MLGYLILLFARSGDRWRHLPRFISWRDMEAENPSPHGIL
jgi:hypothetical protein